MKNSNKSLLESKLRKMVREELGKKSGLLKEENNTITPIFVDHIKVIDRYTGWMLDKNRRNSDRDLLKYVDLIEQELLKIKTGIKDARLQSK